jgi:putative membrane protein
MKRFAFALGMAGAVLAAGCASNEPLPPETAPPLTEPVVDPNSPLAAPMYMQMAASGDLFEIQSSQLALQMSQNPAIRQFAQMLITDHTRLSNTMMATARSAGLTPPPPALLPEQQQMMDQLRMAGANFDETYKNLQIAAHQQALTLHQNYASGGDNEALRSVAAQAVPVIQGHLSQAQMLQLTPPPVYEAPADPGERG